MRGSYWIHSARQSVRLSLAQLTQISRSKSNKKSSFHYVGFLTNYFQVKGIFWCPCRFLYNKWLFMFHRLPISLRAANVFAHLDIPFVFAHLATRMSCWRSSIHSCCTYQLWRWLPRYSSFLLKLRTYFSLLLLSRWHYCCCFKQAYCMFGFSTAG